MRVLETIVDTDGTQYVVRSNGVTVYRPYIISRGKNKGRPGLLLIGYYGSLEKAREGAQKCG